MPRAGGVRPRSEYQQAFRSAGSGGAGPASAVTGPAPTVHAFRFHVLGGDGWLRIADVPRTVAEQAAVACVEWLREIERCFSRFRPDSLVSRLNRGETVEPDERLLSLLAAADLAWRQTAGRLDVTALPLWELWHDAKRSSPPGPREIEAALAQRGLEDIIRGPDGVRLGRPGMALDFGGIGKEWCVDGVVVRLEERGLSNFLVELAGDVAARGRQSARWGGWWVLLPGCQRAALLRDAALATSGHGARFCTLGGVSVSHLIDAHTGRPALGAIRSVTAQASRCLEAGVAASDAALADDAATALERLAGLPGLVRTVDDAFLMDATLAATTLAVEGAENETAPPPPILERCA
jgi:thiamine biosynthesis lipoprotein